MSAHIFSGKSIVVATAGGVTPRPIAYQTRFVCTLDVGSVANARKAVSLHARMEDADEGMKSFHLGPVGDPISGIQIEDIAGQGDPSAVVRFVIACAEAFDLTGLWGFLWSVTCTHPRPDGFSGGAELLDLGRRISVESIECEHWLVTRLHPASHRRSDLTTALRRCLDCATAHLSPSAEACLRSAAESGRGGAASWAISTSSGWFVRTSNAPGEEMPGELSAIIDDARARGADYVNFDDAAPEHGDFPILGRPY